MSASIFECVMQDWLENGPFEWIGGSASHNVGYIALYMWHISDMLYCGLTVMPPMYRA